jgi:hypothetical protein
MASPTGPPPGPYRYRVEVMDELVVHGIRPHGHTPPALVRDFLNDLYCFELRRLRARLLSREFPKSSYAGRVAAVRQRYPLLSIPVEEWLEQPATGAEPPRGTWRGRPCS